MTGSKTTSLIQGLLLLAILVVVVWGIFGPKHYEYRVAGTRDSTLERDMNLAGDQGWEVVSARRAATDSAAEKPEMVYEFVMKRQKPF